MKHTTFAVLQTTTQFSNVYAQCVKSCKLMTSKVWNRLHCYILGFEIPDLLLLAVLPPDILVSHLYVFSHGRQAGRKVKKRHYVLVYIQQCCINAQSSKDE